MGGNILIPGVDPRERAFRWQQNEASKLFGHRFTYRDFAAAATSKTIDFTVFQPLALMEGAFVLLTQNFAGGGAGSATFSTGRPAAPTGWINAVNVFTGASAGKAIALAGSSQSPGTFVNAANAADVVPAGSVRFTLTCDVNTNLLTTGILDVYLRLRFVSTKLSAV